MYDNEILKNYIKDKKYSECISILKGKIVTFLIDQIKQKDCSINFTTVSDLISVSDFYLRDSSIARSLESALMQGNQLEQIDSLVIICERYNIK